MAAEHSASDRLGKQAREVTQDLRQMGEIARDAAQEKLEQLRDKASEYGRDKVQHVERSIEQYIQERPLKSVLIAASIGLLFGRFWMRR